jgi:predicted phosphodiesterase
MKNTKYLRICSDLHLEAKASGNAIHNAIDRFIQLVPPDSRDKHSLLVLAGDISAFRSHMQGILEQFNSRFAGILYVAGNHEFWGSDILQWDAWAETHTRKNVIVAKQFKEVTEFEVSGVRILATTLWTNCGNNPVEEMAVKRMPDFQRINFDGGKITLSGVRAIHKGQLHLLTEALQSSTKPTVVVTHHLPSFSLCDARFAGGLEDGLFASNCDHLLSGQFAPKVWIHGHTHAPINRVLGDTRVICVPVGYPGEMKPLYDPYVFLNLEELNA